MASANDVEMVDAASKPRTVGDYSDLLKTPHADAFAFSEQEQQVLDLYDQLIELELQQSLLRAQSQADIPDVSDLSDDQVQEQLKVAEQEFVQAKAEYELRNQITRNVLMVDPVLKAVHGGEKTGFAEQRLLPLITERDTLSLLHNSRTTKLNDTMMALSAAEQANITTTTENKAKAKELLALAEQVKSLDSEDIQDPRLRHQVTEVEKQVKESRRRSKMMKGIVSGMIVGSGINWAANPELCELVMDDEDEG